MNAAGSLTGVRQVAQRGLELSFCLVDPAARDVDTCAAGTAERE